jgi:hypothetical protein
VEAHEHAVFGGANVDLVAVRAEFEGGAIRFERVLVRELGCAAMADDRGPLAALRDALVALLRLRGRLTRDIRFLDRTMD